MPIHKSSTSVLLLVFLAMVVLLLPVDGRNDEELDPYDMVNFDHVEMKMKKVGTRQWIPWQKAKLHSDHSLFKT